MACRYPICLLSVVMVLMNINVLYSGEEPFKNPPRVYKIKETLSMNSKIIVVGREIVPGSERLRVGSKLLQPYVDYWIDYEFSMIRLNDRWVGSNKTINYSAFVALRTHTRERMFKIDFDSVYKLALKAVKSIKISSTPNRLLKKIGDNKEEVISLAIISKTAIKAYYAAAPDDQRIEKLSHLEEIIDEYLRRSNIAIMLDM